MNKVVAAQIYTVREYTKTIEGVAETLKKVADIGYSAVQISGFGPGIDPKEVAKLVEDNGLTVASTHTGWDRFRNDLDGVIESTSCGIAISGDWGLPGEYHNPDGLKRFWMSWPRLLRSCRGGDGFFNITTTTSLPRRRQDVDFDAVEQADPKMLKAELDVYWVQAGGADPTLWVKKCAGREPLLHLKDMAITPKREVRFAEVGEGNLNWPAILQAAKESGVEWYFVEQDQCYERNPFDSLAISYRNLNAMGLY